MEIWRSWLVSVNICTLYTFCTPIIILNKACSMRVFDVELTSKNKLLVCLKFFVV